VRTSVNTLPAMSTPTGDRIRELREALNMTQETLAQAVGTSASQLSKWERGKVLPDTVFVVPLADALRTTADHLLRTPTDLPRGLAELVANAASIFGAPLTDAEIAWCRAEVRSHGDVSAFEWASRVATKRRGLTPAQAAREASATKAAAAKGAALGVPLRRAKR
jgi:transcriptional regulator with XRE-family HTH domain